MCERHIPKEIKFPFKFLGQKHLKSNKKYNFDTLEGQITGSNEEKVILKEFIANYKNVRESLISRNSNPISPNLHEKSQNLRQDKIANLLVTLT